jgi:hypothetical protein
MKPQESLLIVSGSYNPTLSRKNITGSRKKEPQYYLDLSIQPRY